MKMTDKISITFRDVTYGATGKEFIFTSLSQLYEFIEQEEEFWREQGARFETGRKTGNHGYFQCVSGLEKIKRVIDSWRDQLRSWNEEQLTQQVQNLQRQYSNVLKTGWLWSNHPYTKPFIEYHLEHGMQAAGAFIDYVTKRNFSLSTKEEFLGSMLAHEFFHPDFNTKSRHEEEKRSLDELHDEALDRLEKLREQFELQERKNGQQYRKQQAEFVQQMGTWKQEVQNLEQFYRKVLRWKEPAKHWERAAAEHQRQGLIAIGVLSFAVIVGLALLGGFIYSWLQGQKIGIDLNTLHGIVLFGSILTIYGFFVRVLSRLSFSSFHLMRDAKEREQLTYLYLSLSEDDGHPDLETRRIVLQSLFSRSQTGLLTNESGPSIPSEMLRTKLE